MRTLFQRILLCGLSLAWAPSRADEPAYDFQPPATADDPAAADAVRDLAGRILPVYQDPADNLRYLATLSILQLGAGNYAAADDTRQTLRERRKAADAPPLADHNLAFDVYAHARALAAANTGQSLERVYSQAWRELAGTLSDQDTYALSAWMTLPLPVARDTVQLDFDRARASGRIPQSEAIGVVRDYLALDMRRAMGGASAGLAAEDARRRYQIGDEAVIRAFGADIHLRVVQPKGALKRPALLQFGLAPSEEDARACAAHGYAGVIAWARTRGRKPGGVAPFEHEGDYVRAVMLWIVKQPWSDGRVGLYGEGYAGYAAWSAARHPPKALKAIATADPMAPGIDFPAPGRIFDNAAYPWALAAQSADGRSGKDAATWRAIEQKWYRSGKPYRAFDRVAGLRNWTFDRWLDHPSYDRYWQKFIPFERGFARVGVPALTIAGADDGLGGLYYFTEHQRWRKDADHILLAGPWGADAIRGVSPLLRGQALDPAAQLDLRELRFQWFDHVLHGAPPPAALAERVNLEMPGANQWRRAPTLAALASGTQRWWLVGAEQGDRHRLATAEPAKEVEIQQVVKQSDRGDAAWSPPAEVLSKAVPLHHALAFASEPLAQPLEASGLLRGQLDFKLNRMDVDLNLTLYEQRADGQYAQLAPTWEFRASYAGDRVNRRLLQDGVRQQLDITGEQLLARKLAAGSRLVLVLGVNKRADREFNYGSGGPVADETIADGHRPLRITWYSGSWVELPVRK